MLNTLISLFIMAFTVCMLTFFKVPHNFEFLNRVHTSTLKGIGTLLVLASHIGNHFGLGFLNPLGGIGVTMFLVVSGYGLNESFKKKGLESFISKRFLAILIPYWLVVLFYWVTLSGSFELKRFIGSLLLVNRLSLTWFVYYILMWYIVFYIVKKYLKNDHWFLFFSILSIIFFRETHIVEQAFSITMGIYLSKNQRYRNFIVNKRLKSGLFFLSLGIVFSIAFLYLKMEGIDTPDNYLLMSVVQGIMKTGVAFTIIIFTSHFNSIFYRGLIVIGNLSFEIYLVHAQVLYLLNDRVISIFIFFIVVAIISIGIHIISSQILRRVALY